ncbi:bifunctional riboflavin kinase/FAD synthetase [candidate division KSB1 bacterium]|nr:bifunctional riboflavin kinase/FAD synthetase [candidate division KSB1 bacterium]
MKIFYSTLTPVPFAGTTLTVGTFDGIHKGHQQIINRVREQARALGIQSMLVTFEPHPKIVVQKSGIPETQLLTTIDEKIGILEQMGLDSLVILKFTPSFATLSAEHFVREKLVEKLRMKSIVIGHDHAFGRNREGDEKLLHTLGRELNFSVHTVDPVSASGDKISSTQVRRALQQGDVAGAARMLGRYYSVSGPVVAGRNQGRKLGFPTANIRPDSAHKLVPMVGIYATTVDIRGTTHESVTYIGTRPTFAGRQKVVEVHVFDFDETLYGEPIKVNFCTFLRDDRKFQSPDELIATIKKDKKKAMTYFANGGQG